MCVFCSASDAKKGAREEVSESTQFDSYSEVEMQLSHSVTHPVKFKFPGTTALSVVSRVVKRPPWLPWSARGGGGWVVVGVHSL